MDYVEFRDLLLKNEMFKATIIIDTEVLYLEIERLKRLHGKPLIQLQYDIGVTQKTFQNMLKRGTMTSKTYRKLLDFGFELNVDEIHNVNRNTKNRLESKN